MGYIANMGPVYRVVRGPNHKWRDGALFNRIAKRMPCHSRHAAAGQRDTGQTSDSMQRMRLAISSGHGAGADHR